MKKLLSPLRSRALGLRVAALTLIGLRCALPLFAQTPHFSHQTIDSIDIGYGLAIGDVDHGRGDVVGRPGGGRLHGVALDIQSVDAHAVVGEPVGEGTSDAAAGTGDDRDRARLEAPTTQVHLGQTGWGVLRWVTLS